MLVESFEWDEGNEMHIARHGVRPDEVEEVFEQDYWCKRARDGKYMALGQTVAGRHLAIVYVPLAHGWVRVVTARNMDKKEQKFYRKWRGGQRS